MTHYTNVKVNISEGQRDKLKAAIKAKSSTSIHLGHKDLSGEHILAFTNTQIKRIAKTREKGTGVTLKMSAAQLKHNTHIKGGFLGMLAGLASAALPALARTVLPALGVGALSGLASTGVQKALGNGLFLKKGGCVCQVETDGKRILLKPKPGTELKSFGDGLFPKARGKVLRLKGACFRT